MLYIDNLYKYYGNFPAVQGLTLRIPQGDLFGFVGPNGAGKTTTIRIVCGLLQASSGEVSVNGMRRGSGSAELKKLKKLTITEQDVVEKLSKRCKYKDVV